MQEYWKLLDIKTINTILCDERDSQVNTDIIIIIFIYCVEGFYV